ncbi:MAG: prolyl oligopeptidase family serine peptidase [Clostridia bacterium]
MAERSLRIEDVLDIRHPEELRWDSQGNTLWFLYRVDGRPELWRFENGSNARRLSREGDSVSAYACRGAGAVYAAGGSLVAVGDEAPSRILFQAPGDIAGLAVSLDGGIAFVADGHLWLIDQANPDGPLVRAVDTPHTLLGPISFSPDGRRLLATVLRLGAIRALQVLEVASGLPLLETEGEDIPVDACFLDDDTLAVVRLSPDAIRRQVLLAPICGGQTLLHEEVDARGIVNLGQMAASPAGDAVAFIATVDGYPHLTLFERGREGLTVVLPGSHEDLGEEHEAPGFSQDGSLLVLSSSHGGRPQDRRVYLFDRHSRTCRAVTGPGGTHVDPVITPDGACMAYLGASARESLEVYVRGSAGEDARVTHSMPSAWAEAAVVLPEHLELSSLDGFRFHADLYRPPHPRETPGPALIYVHGGPMRQMRAGFHPMHPYAVFHAWNQYLLQQGYVILSIDFRGGTGYGVDFERGNYQGPGQGDLADVIAGARHLKTLPDVDPARVGIWGLSYGGYLTLLSLTKFPQEFRMGVNIAGMWTYAESTGVGRVRFWERRLGGPRRPETEVHYREASPADFADQLTAPLLNLHGTADESVEFQQLDQIVRDLTRLHKAFEVMYYPGETHFFHRRESWEDAFSRMERAFTRDLAGWPTDAAR